jgi:hypothetical protein
MRLFIKQKAFLKQNDAQINFLCLGILLLTSCVHQTVDTPDAKPRENVCSESAQITAKPVPANPAQMTLAEVKPVAAKPTVKQTATDPSIWNTCYANPSHAKNVLSQDTSDVGQLDYALFLFAFIPSPNKERNAKVKEITDALVAKAKQFTKDQPEMQVLFKGKTSFDGSNKSLVSVLRILSCSGLTNTHASFYAIPCPILKGRPELLEAIAPYFGSNLDERLPRCGLWYGRGSDFFYRWIARFLPLEDLDNYCKVLKSSITKYLGQKSFDERHIRSIYEQILFDKGRFRLNRQRIRGLEDERIANAPEFKAAFEKTKAALLERFANDKFDSCLDMETTAVNVLNALAAAHVCLSTR